MNELLLFGPLKLTAYTCRNPLAVLLSRDYVLSQPSADCFWMVAGSLSPFADGERFALDKGFEVRGLNRPFALSVFLSFQLSFPEKLTDRKRRTFQYLSGLTWIEGH